MSACPKCGDDKFYDLHCSRCGFDTVELLVTERDAAREELASVVSVAKGYEETNRRLRAEVERLREALRVMWMFYAGRARQDMPASDFDEVRAALAGAPSERKPMLGGFEGVPTGALVVPGETRRALAERVREACAEMADHARPGIAGDRVRDIDLDALLEEP